MPYGYYQVVRIYGIIGFSILAFDAHKNNLVYMAFVFGIAAILFNPIIKISFEKNIWHILDAGFIAAIIYNAIFNKRKSDI
jgi:xanthine/uracil permease